MLETGMVAICDGCGISEKQECIVELTKRDVYGNIISCFHLCHSCIRDNWPLIEEVVRDIKEINNEIEKACSGI